jgi:hypothetical protein
MWPIMQVEADSCRSHMRRDVHENAVCRIATRQHVAEGAVGLHALPERIRAHDRGLSVLSGGSGAGRRAGVRAGVLGGVRV